MIPMRGAGRDQQMADDTKARKPQAILALHDLGSRPGATARGIRAAMLKEGFTDAEISAAAQAYAAGEDL